MAIKYLGHKEHLLSHIKKVTNDLGPIETVADLFSGTGSVSRLFREMNIKVHANDILKHCTVLARTNLLLEEEPNFEGLVEYEPALRKVPLPLLFDTPYNRVLTLLNMLPGTEGFFFKNYSPGEESKDGIRRMYFTEDNARKIDSIRITIRDWYLKGFLSDIEHSLLLKDLMFAVNGVANIAGTYGYFMSKWGEGAKHPIHLVRSKMAKGRTDHIISQMNANHLAKEVAVDLAFLDPPYTKRQYSAYYHILETIANEDEPKISGKSGLRNWEENASDYCYKRLAPTALEDLISSLDTKNIILSYNEDGQIEHDAILDMLSSRGEPKYLEFSFPRFKSNSGGTKGREVKERLYSVQVRR